MSKTPPFFPGVTRLPDPSPIPVRTLLLRILWFARADQPMAAKRPTRSMSRDPVPVPGSIHGCNRIDTDEAAGSGGGQVHVESSGLRPVRPFRRPAPQPPPPTSTNPRTRRLPPLTRRLSPRHLVVQLGAWLNRAARGSAPPRGAFPRRVWPGTRPRRRRAVARSWLHRGVRWPRSPAAWDGSD